MKIKNAFFIWWNSAKTLLVSFPILLASIVFLTILARIVVTIITFTWSLLW